MTNSRIKIFTCGGTIDKNYFDAKSEYQVGTPQIVNILKEANVTFDYEIVSIMKKDSLDMEDSDRELIYKTVNDTEDTHILITHGTDGLVKTALALTSIPGKTIVLTGSMQPAQSRISDAIFNIGYAIAAIHILPAGVYVAMNGQILDPRHTEKNRKKNIFEQK